MDTSLQQIQDNYNQKKAIEESHFLARMSRILIGAWDFAAMMAKLNPGESLTVNRDGEIFKGRVKTEKLTKLAEKLPRYIQSDFDTEGFKESMRTKSLVISEGSPRKNAWDFSAIKAPKNIDSPMVELILQRLEKISPGDIVEVNHMVSSTHKYMEITIKGFPITPGIHEKTGTIYYYYFNGKKFDVR
jgi:hypothetical protein